MKAKKERMGLFEAEAYAMFYGTGLIVIIGLIAAITIPAYMTRRDRRDIELSKNKLKIVCNVLSKTRQEHGETEHVINDAIKIGILNSSNLIDAWGKRIIFQKNNDSLYIISLGKNGVIDFKPNDSLRLLCDDIVLSIPRSK
jgi:type II secretory pathway pseudopilin PulG